MSNYLHVTKLSRLQAILILSEISKAPSRWSTSIRDVWAIIGGPTVAISIGVFDVEQFRSALDDCRHLMQEAGLDASFPPPQLEPPNGKAWHFEEAIIELVISADNAAPQYHYADPVQQYLILAEDDLAEARRIYHELYEGATTHRWTSFKSNSVGDGFAFWVLEDKNRGSANEGVRRSLCPGAHVLRGLQVEGRVLFWEEDLPIDPRAVGFCLMAIENTATQFYRAIAKPHSYSGETRPLAALVADRRTSTTTLLYLGNALFIDTPPTGPGFQSQVIDVDSVEPSADRQNFLQQDLDASRPNIGYRLHLARLPALDRDLQEFEKKKGALLKEIESVNWRLQSLESMAPSMPVLYRFSHLHLEDFANVLQHLSPKDIQGEKVKYGFVSEDHAHPESKAGMHYLWISGASYLNSRLGSIIEDVTPDSPSNRFQIDPSFAKYYRPRANDFCIMCPKGFMLLPEMHAWDGGTHLRELLRKHVYDALRERDPNASLPPERSAFLFDHSMDDRVDLTISVVDLDQLKPLRVRLPFLNRALIAARRLGADSMIQTFANEEAAQQLIAQSQEDARGTLETMEQEFDQLEQHVLSQAQILHHRITDNLKRSQVTLTDAHSEFVANEAQTQGFLDFSRKLRQFDGGHEFERLTALIAPEEVENPHQCFTKVISLLEAARNQLSDPGLQGQIDRLRTEALATQKSLEESQRTDPQEGVPSTAGLPSKLGIPLARAKDAVRLARQRRTEMQETMTNWINDLDAKRNELFARLMRALFPWR